MYLAYNRKLSISDNINQTFVYIPFSTPSPLAFLFPNSTSIEEHAHAGQSADDCQNPHRDWPIRILVESSSHDGTQGRSEPESTAHEGIRLSVRTRLSKRI